MYNSEMPAEENIFYSHLFRIKIEPNNLISMKMLLQDFHCDSASQSVAKAVVVRIFKLSDNYYVGVKE